MNNKRSVLNTLENIQVTSQKIISELEKKEPDVREFQSLYILREKQIKALNELKFHLTVKSQLFDKTEKQTITHNFSQIKLLEETIQKGLNTLVDQKKASLESVILQNKIKNSYTGDDKGTFQKSKHLDITST